MIVTRIGIHRAGLRYSGMSDDAPPAAIPPSVDRVLRFFRALSREEKMQALVQYSRKLEPLPERLRDVDRSAYTVPECQTRVDLFPELQPDGTLHFFADVDARRSPTVAAFLAILLSAVNDHPPAVALGIPADFARQMMDSIGLGAREVGLNAMLARIKRYAAQAQVELTTHGSSSSHP
jgi:cysteine desulfuration protein SufE